MSSDYFSCSSLLKQWKGGKRDAHEVNRSQGISTDNIIHDGEDWTCDQCGSTVPGQKTRCGSCHRWRGGRRQGGWKLGSFGADPDDLDDGIDRTQDWTCCGQTIPAEKTRIWSA